jgi:palmitoyltransferase
VIYAGLYYVLPLKAVQLSVMWWAHVSMAMWLGFNILFNYYCCARTNPGTHDSPEYQRLVSEARADGKIHEEAAAASSSDEDAGGKGGWMNRGPFEWGWDYSTRTPKAPRAHYDHVSKKLVLNMDHYCPWMFNCVGYLNYRHFVLFMMYTWMGCAYVALETLGPFLEFSKSQRGRRHHHKHPEPAPSPTEHYYRDMMKHNYEASGHELSHMEWSTIRRNITFTFMITLSVGIAITLLLSFHIYLTLSAQTTIEFYGNRVKSFRASSLAHRSVKQCDSPCPLLCPAAAGVRQDAPTAVNSPRAPGPCVATVPW